MSVASHGSTDKWEATATTYKAARSFSTFDSHRTMEVIELLSDGEEDGVGTSLVQRAGVRVHSRTRSVSSSTNKRDLTGGDGSDVILIDDDDDSPKQDRRAVKNPYEKKPRSQLKNIGNKGVLDVDRANTEKKQKGEIPKPNSAARSSNTVENPYKKKRKPVDATTKPRPRKALLKPPPERRELQAGLVFGEDVDHVQSHGHSHSSKKSIKQSSSTKASVARSKASESTHGSSDENDNQPTVPASARDYAQHQFTTRLSHNLPPILYHDPDFVAGSPATIDGAKSSGGKKKKQPGNGNDDRDSIAISTAPPKCRCRPPKPCALAYSTKAGPNRDRPFYCCHRRGSNGGCNFFSWAFTSSLLHWYRFGSHTGHCLVKRDRGFRAEDLVQGKVGDCWFLSALAVVAEREDLIGRLIGSSSTNSSNNYGVIEVTLFVDGYWKKVIIDDFLPCLVDQQSEKEDEDIIQLALRQSLVDAGMDPKWQNMKQANGNNQQQKMSSKFDPNSIADECRRTLNETHEFLHHDRFNKDPSYRSSDPRSSFVGRGTQPLSRKVSTSDLAYSKARNNQLWVPFLEKAYAKIHGSYRAISGGHVEEAFLDLTGAPTAVFNFDHHDFNPRQFWRELMSFRSKRLPMGCGTSTSQGGIVGMHAYSILDVREIKNVGLDFFRDKVAQGTLGNVSGFTELDGTVRLMRIRNPHGQGEWKGEFSDKSPVWERLMANKNVNWKESNGVLDLTVTTPTPCSPELKRTMVNDGTFWIDYDSFLMGFSNVDVVLAFKGNHAKSFASNFPVKASNHRCTRAFELSAVGRQPGEETYNDQVEVYVMCIQNTRRGASLGRADRKVSYKACDIGILVGECSNTNEDGQIELGSVSGRFFGMNRNGHLRIVLDRSNPDRKLIVMPVSFGHPSATDEDRSFAVRFVADSPLLVREVSNPPKLNTALQNLCFGEITTPLGNPVGTSQHRGVQGTTTVLMECTANNSSLFKIIRIDCLQGGGGTVLLYLIVNDEVMSQMNPLQKTESISFSIEINCRGMICRTANGLENHEVISKGKKFEAAWRRFSLSFKGETKSRLLAAVVQGGQDYQFGSVKCSSIATGKDANSAVNSSISKYMNIKKSASQQKSRDQGCFANYEDFGLYASFETPSSILRCDCIDLSFPLQNQNMHSAQKSKPIEIHSDSAEVACIDQNLDAAIMASIVESNGVRAKENHSTEAQSSFAQDLEKAIAMSLKQQ